VIPVVKWILLFSIFVASWMNTDSSLGFAIPLAQNDKWEKAGVVSGQKKGRMQKRSEWETSERTNLLKVSGYWHPAQKGVTNWFATT